MRYFGVELTRQNFSDLSTDEKPCSDWDELGASPGFNFTNILQAALLC